MKILIISNNANSNNDGIGKHAKMVCEGFKRIGYYSTLVTENSGYDHYLSFISLKMSWAYCRASFQILVKKFDFVIVEYPFKEHNPIVLLFHILLYYISHARSTNVVLSLHEYDRVNVLRRRVIDVLILLCDILFVSEDKYLNRFKKNHIYKRSITVHFNRPNYPKTYKKTKYCYFGLINSSKCIKEMLEAWDVFNYDEKYELDVITASDTSEYAGNNHKNVRFYENLSNEDASMKIYESTFSIIPVIPEIGYNNSSLMSTIKCGCIPIGLFNEELRIFNFFINVNSYVINDFLEGLTLSQSLSLSQIIDYSEKCIEFERSVMKDPAEQMAKVFEFYNINHYDNYKDSI